MFKTVFKTFNLYTCAQVYLMAAGHHHNLFLFIFDYDDGKDVGNDEESFFGRSVAMRVHKNGFTLIDILASKC